MEDPLPPQPYVPLIPQAPAQSASDPLPIVHLPQCPLHHLMSKTPALSQQGSGSAQPDNLTSWPRPVRCRCEKLKVLNK